MLTDLNNASYGVCLKRTATKLFFNTNIHAPTAGTELKVKFNNMIEEHVLGLK